MKNPGEHNRWALGQCSKCGAEGAVVLIHAWAGDPGASKIQLVEALCPRHYGVGPSDEVMAQLLRAEEPWGWRAAGLAIGIIAALLVIWALLTGAMLL